MYKADEEINTIFQCLF